MSLYSILLIMHLIGIALGAGGAFMGDFLFWGNIRAKGLGSATLGSLRIASRVIWLGVFVLILSGFGLLWQGDFLLLSSSTFQAKFTIIFFLIANGILLHFVHLPFLEKNVKKLRSASPLVHRKLKLMFLSGALSGVSWLSIIVLGYTRSLPYTYTEILSGYGVILLGAFAIALLVKHFAFPAGGLAEESNSANKPMGDIAKAILVVGVMGALIFSLFAFARTFQNSSTVTSESREELVLTPKSELENAPSGEAHLSYAPLVPPAITRTDQRIFEVHLEVIENICDIDPKNGVKFDTWGYRIKGDDEVSCGAPGPVFRGRVGDVARVTLTNLEDNKHPHNIDFHAVTGQGGGARDLTVAPGETATIEVRLLYPGVFMYHCAYADVPVHISHGSYGAFVVDPESPLPGVDHEWAVMQSEWYLTEPDENGDTELDRVALADEEPKYITFNGRTDALIGDNALSMNVGERARIYFVNEGLNLDSNFHPIGSHWDIVYPEGATHPSNRTIYGSQSTLVVAGGGTVTELVAKVPSTVILVDHALSRTFYKGAIGQIVISGKENSELFEVIKPSSEVLSMPATMQDAGENGNVVEVSMTLNSGNPANADRAYLPRDVRIPRGTTVVWTNDDGIMHTVTSGGPNNPDGKFNSGFMRPKETFSYTFNEAGVHPYFCIPHPWAQGTIIVE